jgi:hypothetical protein
MLTKTSLHAAGGVYALSNHVGWCEQSGSICHDHVGPCEPTGNIYRAVYIGETLVARSIGPGMELDESVVGGRQTPFGDCPISAVLRARDSLDNTAGSLVGAGMNISSLWHSYFMLGLLPESYLRAGPGIVYENIIDSLAAMGGAVRAVWLDEQPGLRLTIGGEISFGQYPVPDYLFNAA